MKLDIYDIFIILGIIILSTGLWLYNPVVSLCVIGIIVLFLGIAGSTKKGGES